MSEQPTIADVPTWDVADRMRKSLRHSGLGVQEMADYLGVRNNTVSTWINGKIKPSTQTLRLWALRCGVPYEWLRSGQVTSGSNTTSSLTRSARAARSRERRLTRRAADLPMACLP